MSVNLGSSVASMGATSQVGVSALQPAKATVTGFWEAVRAFLGGEITGEEFMQCIPLFTSFKSTLSSPQAVQQFVENVEGLSSGNCSPEKIRYYPDDS
jgi:hypothetical protein